MRDNFTNKSKEFDCSDYLGHGLEWPVTQYNVDRDWTNGFSRDNESDEYYTKCRKQLGISSVAVQDLDALLQEEIITISKQENNALQEEILSAFQKEKILDDLLTEHYYENEYNSLLEWMDKGEIILPPPSQFVDKRQEIQQFSLLADKAIGGKVYNNAQLKERVAENYMCQDLVNRAVIDAIEPPYSPDRVFINIDQHCYDAEECSSMSRDTLNEVHIKAIESESPPYQAASPRGFENFVEEQGAGFGWVNEKQPDQDKVFRKRRLCRHFVKGFCLRGTSCKFLHDLSFFCADDQKVFLGGLPPHLTPEMLKTKLEDQGLTVLNKPRIMRGFTPQVCVGSVDEAKKLIAQRFIYIDEYRVDVRPYKDRYHLRKGFPSVVKRSVFLGGLPDNTTGEIIIADLQHLDMKVVGIPLIKNGFAPRVVLESLEHAKMLIAMKRVIVNGTAVDVRPYVNFRKRY